MSQYILVARRNDPRWRNRGELVTGVKSALYIPTGMQGLGAEAREVPPSVKITAENMVRSLVKKGVPLDRAKQIVKNALLKMRGHGWAWGRRGVNPPVRRHPHPSPPFRSTRTLEGDWRDTNLNTMYIVPPGMPGGVGQFYDRAAGYMQVEPAYERPVHGLGDIREAVVGLIAGQDLDKLISAAQKLGDEVIRGIEFRNKIIEQYREARSLLDEATRQFGPAMLSTGFSTVPNPPVVPAYTAFASAKNGVQILARQVQTLGMMDRVFSSASVELEKAGAKNDANSIDMILAQVRRFTIETDNMFSVAPEYMDAKRAILTRVGQLYGVEGVGSNDVGNPKWLALYVKAANEIVPIPQPDAPSEVMEAGLGALPVLAAVIIWVVGIVAAAVVASKAISQVIDAFNSKAITSRQIALEAEKRKGEELARLRARGASQKEIDDAMKSIDGSTKEAIAAVPDTAPSFGATAVVGVLAAAIAAKLAGVF